MSDLVFEPIRERAGEMSQHAACSSLDALFLALWAALNYGVHLLVSHMHVSEVDHVILIALEIVFGIATIAPICIWLYKDLFIMVIRANRKIKAERENDGLPPHLLPGGGS